MSKLATAATVLCAYVYAKDDREHPGEQCPDAVFAKGYCTKHYTQSRRKRLGKTHEIAPPGEGDQITFHCEKRIKAMAEKAAKAHHVSVGEYLRRLIEADTER